jgi:hypothetical protein
MQDRKTLFLSFRNLLELKLTWDFWSINILSRETPGDQEVNETRPSGQIRPGGTGPWPGCATQACLSLGPPMSSIFASRCSVWPKNTYIKTPSTTAVRRRWRNIKHRNRGCSSEDWRGKHYRSRPRSLLHPLRHQYHHHRHEEGVVHLWTTGLWQ